MKSNLYFISKLEDYISYETNRLRKFYLNGNKNEKKIVKDILYKLNAKIYNIIKEIKEEEKNGINNI